MTRARTKHRRSYRHNELYEPPGYREQVKRESAAEMKVAFKDLSHQTYRGYNITHYLYVKTGETLYRVTLPNGNMGAIARTLADAKNFVDNDATKRNPRARRNPSEMQIKFKTPWRNFKYRYEVPARTLKNQFDHLTEEDGDGYFKFRRYWYHISDFMRTQIPGWDGIAPDSAFSGVLLKVSKDGEQYQAALALS